ncbi:ribonucleoside triphosphate reductase [Prolixibacteraceae bacterium JC049]|nr:ribonucleoside triphosphate reductase [Prolixibacteraceae bacterium JC049]
MCNQVSHVLKRDGKIVAFVPSKIANAITKAFEAVEEGSAEIAQNIAQQVAEKLAAKSTNSTTPHVEEVQDLVEEGLFENKLFKAAKAYILYRNQHKEIRNTKELFNNLDLIDNYLKRADWRVKESANSTYSLQGLNQHLATIVSSQYWLNKIYPKEIGDAHKNGDMHIHDLGFLSVYCVGWDLEDLLLSGFTGVPGKLQSKPAKHLRTALGQIVNFFYTMQGEAAGAQAFSNFDTYLAPFIAYDNLDRIQLKQAIQEFLFNINVPTRVGFQTPFTNITMDLVVPDFLKSQPVIIGGKIQDKCYDDFQDEVELFNEVFAEVMAEGDANGRIFSFPIPTYNITSNFDWDNPRYNNIWEITAKYGIPYFSNFVNSDLSPDDVRSMCCRLRLDKRELETRGGGLFGSNPLTGSVGVVTINLPRLGYQATNKEEFYQLLSKRMEMASSSLETKRKVIEELTENGLFPYSKFYLRNIRKKGGSYWYNHFSTIGLVGMNECCLNLIGSDITSTEGHEFACEVLDFMRNKLQDFQQETGNNYNLEATPAEGTSYRLAQLDRKWFDDIIVANQEACNTPDATPYYTNSTQLPVKYTDDIFHALELQDDLQTRYTGGTVFHTFIGAQQLPIESVKQVIKKITNNYHLPYITLSPTFSICPHHGYQYGEHHYCPQCEAEGKKTKCEVYTRIVGYIRPVDQWNDGKQAEYGERKLFDKEIVPIH